MINTVNKAEITQTLDPDNWEELRGLGHRMVDDMLEYLQNIRSRPTLMPTKDALEEIHAPLTDDGEGEERVYDIFQRSILPYTMTFASPRIWGAVAGPGSPYGMLAEMLRAGMNGGQEFSFAESHVNAQVIDWTKEMIGFPSEAGGVLVSGGSEANFTALAVARNTMADVDIKSMGVQSLSRRMIVYCGDQTHLCLDRSVELLGLGNQALRRIPTDDHFRVRIDELKRAIQDDRSRGHHPFCVVACAGTTNTGSFDDLNALADLAKAEGMWLHIDGAFGAWVRISRTHKHLADGIERADSLAVDFHKWMNMPYSIGCTLVRDRRAHFATFAYGHDAEYLKSAFDLSEDQLGNPHNLALALSRNFSSLKAYMLLRAFGKNRYRSLIQKSLDQTGYLAELIKDDPELELVAPVASNVVCFRYSRLGLGEDELAKLNKMILNELDQEHFWMVSDTTIKDKYTLRACNVNHRTSRDDLAFMVDLVKKTGRKVVAGSRLHNETSVLQK